MAKFGIIRQKISAFLLKEDGKISKGSVLKAGILLGAIAISVKGSRGEIEVPGASYKGTPYIFWKGQGGIYHCWCDGSHAACGGGIYSGNCGENVDANSNPNFVQGGEFHTNGAHNNGVSVKNLFGRLLFGHGNCVETHFNHKSTGGC